MPLRLALLSVAIPLPFVVADPTVAPLSLKVIVLPLTALPLDVSVAESVVMPPYVPVAAAALNEVGWMELTKWAYASVKFPFEPPLLFEMHGVGEPRSEERRVRKECRSRWVRDD